MTYESIPAPIVYLIEKYGHPATSNEQPGADQASDEACIKTVIADLNALGSQLGLPKQSVYHKFKEDLANLIGLRQNYVQRDLVCQAIYNGWRLVDLALMRRDEATMRNMRKFESLTPEQIIDAGSDRPK